MQPQLATTEVVNLDASAVNLEQVTHQWIERVPAAIALVDRELRYVAMNHRWIANFQPRVIPSDAPTCPLSLRGVSHLDIFWEKADQWAPALNQGLTGQSVQGDEFSWVRTDGSRDWWQWEANPWYAGEGKTGPVMGLVVAMMPITRQKDQIAERQQAFRQLQHQYVQRTQELRRTIAALETEISDRLTLEEQLRAIEKKLQANEKHYQQILNAIADLVLVKGPESRILWANQAFCDYYGMSHEELNGLMDSSVGPPDYTQQTAVDDTVVFTTGQTRVVEEPIVGHDGTTRHFSTTQFALQDETGQVVMTVGVSHDLTGQRQAEHDQRQVELELRQSQHRMNLFLQKMPIALMEWDKAHRIVEWNPAAEQIFGYRREEVLGQPLTILVPELVRPTVNQVVHNLLDEKNSLCSVNKNVTKDGRTIVCEWHNTPIVDADGTLSGVISMAIDITDRTQAEAQLEAQAQFLRGIYEGVEDALFTLAVGADGQLRFGGWNSKCAQITSITSEAAAGKTPEELFGPDLGTKLTQQYRHCVETKKPFRYEEERTFAGETGWWLTNLKPLLDATGRITQIIGTASDISDRKRAEAQVQQQEQFLRSIYDGVSHNIFVVDVLGDHSFLYADYNRACEQLTGRTRSEVAGKRPDQLYSGQELIDVCTVFQHCAETKTAFTQEEHLTFKTGDRWLMTTFNPIQDENGRVYRIVGTAVDITSLKRVEATLQETLRNAEYQSQLLRTVLDSTPDWIFAKDQTFRYILVNESYARAIGLTCTELLGKTDLEIGFTEEQVLGDVTHGIRGFRTDDRAALAGQSVHNPNDPATLADGTQRIFDSRKVPLYDPDGQIFAMLGLCRDVTDRYHAEAAIRRSEATTKEKAAQLQQTLVELKHTQAQLVQNEKMSGLGQLVAGVAHEINNPVNFIYGNLNHAKEYTQDLLSLLELYQQYYPDPVPAIQNESEAIDLDFLMEDLPKLIASMKVGAERIQSIVASLRTFSRMDEAEMKAVNIHDGIDSTLMILQHRLKPNEARPEIVIQREYGELPLVECYAGQLNQVFMNILGNAIEALEDGYQTRSPKTSDPVPLAIAIRTTVLPSEQVEIRLQDNGPGIPKAIQQRLFDPFFTTKPIGKGTGMGLSISYQIVAEKHHGTLVCESEPGQGSTFIIRIPLTQVWDG